MINADRGLELLVVASLKGTLVLVIAWALMTILKRASASVRHWICSLALVSTIAIPLLQLAAPVWFVPILPNASNPSDNVTVAPNPDNSLLGMNTHLSGMGQSTVASVPQPTGKISKPTARSSSIVPVPTQQNIPGPDALAIDFSLSALVLALWLIGGLIALTRWFEQAYRVWRITRRGTLLADVAWSTLRDRTAYQSKINRAIRLVLSDEVTVPLTWGIWQPTVVLPVAALDWSCERSQIVLVHELAHIARWDYLTQWLALISCAINWFNPFVWNMARLLSEAREQACDDRVLTMGTKSSDYAVNLLEISQAIQHKWTASSGVLAMGQSSNLGKRIHRILDMGQSRSALTRTRSLMFVLLLAIAILPLSTMQLSRASAQNNTITISVALAPGMKDQLGDGLAKDFETAHPGVSVAFVDSPDVPDPVDGLDAYFTNVQKVANSADVIITATYGGLMSVVPEGTRAGYFLDLAPLVNSDSSLNVDDYYPQVWKSFQWDNGIWALPSSADLAVLSYDKTAFDQAGLAYPTGKWTVDDFSNAVTKLTVKDANGNITRAGFANSGRIFRLALWQSLLGNTKLYDENSVPNQPQFSKPNVETILDTYHQLEQSGSIGGDPGSAAMIVDDIAHASTGTRSAALLPGDKAGLMAAGFAISAGTQHPDLAYALAKYLTLQGETNILRIPARKSLAAQMGQDTRLTAVKDLMDKALTNGMTFAEMRYTSYLNAAWASNVTNARDAVQNVELRAINDLKAADAKKGTLALIITEPVAPVLAPGKIALNFDVTTYFDPSANKDRWDRVVQDFTASDAQVGIINVRHVYESAAQAATKSDCFYLPSNEVPMLTGNAVLDLTPFLSADPAFDKSDFVGNMLASVQRDNKTYALPIDIEPLILQYSPAKFSAVSLPEPTNTWTVESFVDALHTLKQNSQGQGPFVDAGSNGTYLLVLMADYGGLPLDYRTNPPTINFTDPTTVTAIQQVLDLAKNGFIRYGALGSLTDGPNIGPTDTTAIYPNALNGFPGRKIAPGTTPDKSVLFPMGHQYTGMSYSLGTAYISTQSQNPEACYRFISTIAKHPELFSSMPARHSLLASQDLKASTNPDTLALYTQVDTLLKDSHTIAIPSFQKGDVSVSNFLLQHWLFEAFDAYVLNGTDLSTALQAAEGYARTYQGCAANLPPMTLGDANSKAPDTLKPYVDCAEKADNRLKPILDPLVSH